MSDPLQKNATAPGGTSDKTDGGATAAAAEVVTELERKIWFSSYIRTLIEQVGPEILVEANRLRAFLMDQFPAPRDRREIRALHLAAEQGIAEAMHQAATDDRRLDVEAQRQRYRLEEHLGLAPALAAWTIDVLMLAVRDTRMIAPQPEAAKDVEPPVVGAPPDAEEGDVVSHGAIEAPAPPADVAAAPEPAAAPVEQSGDAPPPEAPDPAADLPQAAVGEEVAEAAGLAAEEPAAAVVVPPLSPAPAPVTPSEPAQDPALLQKKPRRWRRVALALAVVAALGALGAYLSQGPSPTTPSFPSQPFTPSLLVLNGTYTGTRGWTQRSPGTGTDVCQSSYDDFNVTVSNGSISFVSEGDTWSGSIDQQTGEVDISSTDKSNLYIRGRAYNGSSATMAGGRRCVSGYFRFR